VDLLQGVLARVKGDVADMMRACKMPHGRHAVTRILGLWLLGLSAE